MSRIRILPDILSNKIAAGEVVERPASVVKELVENALDAGSRQITVAVEKGGRSLIRVTDDGMGMDHDDALLCIERYATSKILTDEDLFSIRTLGFRGEALPSIASVSRLTLETRTAEASSGIRIQIEGGEGRKVQEAGVPAGTGISVRDLFFNTPARRKFLKTVNTEMGHIGDIISTMALGYPGVRFRLDHNEKTIRHWIPCEEPRDRIADVLGATLEKDLFPVSAADGETKIDGWVSSQRFARKTAGGVYLFVNGRAVKDRVIFHALFEGYAGRLVKGQYPMAVIFVTLPPDGVDVNVHPTKSEVRFVESRIIHQLVKNAVMRAVTLKDTPRWTPAAEKEEPETPMDMGNPFPGLAERLESFGETEPVALPAAQRPFSGSYPSPAASDSVPTRQSIFPDFPAASKIHSPPAAPERRQPKLPSAQENLWNPAWFSDLRLIGQFRNTYILCESNEGLILIDQHAAHERILYEKLKSPDRKPFSVQQLLIPETMEFSWAESEALEKLIPVFVENRIQIEPFGQNTFVVKAVPSLLAKREIRPLVREVVEKSAALGMENQADLLKIIDECRMIIACHSAIRANQSLTDEEMKGLFRQLDGCENPSRCPHGRPTWVKWSLEFLEKSFYRVV